MKTQGIIWLCMLTMLAIALSSQVSNTFYTFDKKQESTTIDPPLKSTNEIINISGTVTGNIYGDSLANAMVKFYLLNDTLNALGSTFTNSNGFYSKIIFLTNLKENTKTPDYLYPNPYKNNTSIIFNSQTGGNYTLQVFDLEGKNLHSQNLTLTQGTNQINLEGGNKGIHLIQITNNQEQKTYKVIQTENTNPQFKATFSSLNFGNYKSTTDSDSLLIKASKTGFQTGKIKKPIQPNIQANIELIQEPYEFTTTLKPFLETGEPVTTINPTFYVTIDWAPQGIIPGTTINYPVMNGEINILRYMYPHNGNLGNALIYNDTTDLDGDGYWLSNWSIGRLPHQITNVPNIYQNESSLLIPAQKTTINLNALEGQIIHHYTIKNKAETQPGTYENLNSIFTRALIQSSGQALSSMFIDLAPFGVADSLDIVLKTYNETTNVPMEQWQIDRATNVLNALLNTRYLPNGDTLLPPHRFYTISSTSDPRWQALIARGFENSIRLAFYNSTPSNGQSWASTYTYNEHLRLKTTSAKFNPNNSNGTINAEIVSAITGMEEGTGDLSPYVSTLDGLPTDYCESISTMPVLLNLGTGDAKDGKNNQPILKDYETLSVETTHNADGTTAQKKEITDHTAER